MKIPAMLLILGYAIPGYTQHNVAISGVYPWKEPGQTESPVLLAGKSASLDFLEVSAVILTDAPREEDHAFEELVIVKEGNLKVTVNEEEKTLGPGSVALFVPGETHRLESAGKGPVTYYVLKFTSRVGPNAVRGKDAGGSFTVDRNTVPFKPHGKGGVRQFIERPTTMFERLEMHVTTLNAGLKSHDPHTHRAAEIVLMIHGDARMQIGDKLYSAGPGAVIFLDSDVLHAIENTGDTPCEYFAFQWQ
ncbi:MAG TPA: cupin domain-containing protein [Ohtaekwangia sp.]|nr:cupin domain-containing protein [Ohtaekwangia sp.]